MLSRKKRHCRFFELRIDTKLFWEMQKEDMFVRFFSDEAWLKRFSDLANIFHALYKFNLKPISCNPRTFYLDL